MHVPAASPEPAVLFTDPWTVLPVPARARPPLLTPVPDPTFGTTVTRITGDADARIFPGLVWGTWGRDARHVYSKQQPWNADGSLLLVQNRQGGTPSRVFLGGSSYLPTLGPCPGDPLYDYRWHPRREFANTMINVDGNGLELSWFDVRTCTQTRSWKLPFAVKGIGSGEGNPSLDGRYVALGDRERIFVVDMDPQPPFPPYPFVRVGPAYAVLPCSLDASDPSDDCKIGNVSISPSGRYIDLKFSGGTSLTQDMHRILEVDPLTLAIQPHRMDDASLRCDTFKDRPNGWIFPLKHADLALDPFDGNEDVIVGGRSCPGTAIGRVVKVRLRDGKVTPLTDPSGEPSVQHVSTRNVDRPGWAYVGYYKAVGKRFSDEIVAVSLDGSGAVERLAHKHSRSSGCYRCESHPVPSRDGKRVLFASNWAEDCGSACGSSDEIKEYVVTLASAAVDALDPLSPTAPTVALALDRIVPNPAVSGVLIDYTLGVDEAVRLELLDVAGRRVDSRDLGRPGPGRHQVRVDRTAGLRPGVYWARLRTETRTAIGKLVFVPEGAGW